ncbi:hypothetical protein VCRA2119O147_220019 [Vibrio crassostreae]|uniref:Uncharacterized protein n=1 Tax=Vibrio crassostreae TaxID=246167 RepID=A0A822N0Q4_9VIBR|nr:hypothetical protein VCRA2117O328_100033 [Vibrio crassostreae]CAK1695180.1 hypothetical protein VCRA2113O212_100035 [Vibrio crassostreae]CAK1695245.1 hypothetical protein VCRA2113O194_100036 [Vibrio crassostreae]CAK1695379.1 hypothetical protein VCRA2112O188_100036 [Vibrio crassostreae]CAK1695578.1 hypothetical protein VCRA2113O231_100036 [Vibrio crassostreae]
MCEDSFSISASDSICGSKDSETISGGIFSRQTDPQQWCSTLDCTLEKGVGALSTELMLEAEKDKLLAEVD